MRSFHCGLSDRPLHKTDVQLFTHAFSANVSSQSAQFMHDGGSTDFLQISYLGRVWSCRMHTPTHTHAHTH